MAVSTSDVCRVTVEGVGASGQDVQNVWYFKNISSGVSEAEAIDDFVELLEALYALVSALISTIYVVRRIRAVNITDDTDVGDGLFSDDTPGVNGGSVMPPQNAAGLVLTTSRLRVRGRKFFGMIGDDQADNEGVLSAAAILDLADVGDYVTEALVATNTSWQLGVVASSDGAFLPFISYVIPTTVVTQRRRRRSVGS